MTLSLVAALAQVPLLLVGLHDLGDIDTWFATLILHEPLWFQVTLASLVGGSAALAIGAARGAERRRLLRLTCGFAIAAVAIFQLDAAILRWTAVIGSRREGWLLSMGPTGYPQAAFIGLSTLALVSRVHAESIALDEDSQGRQAWRRLAAPVTVAALVHVPFYWWGMERALRSSLVHWELPGVGHLVALVVFDLMARAARQCVTQKS